VLGGNAASGASGSATVAEGAAAPGPRGCAPLRPRKAPPNTTASSKQTGTSQARQAVASALIVPNLPRSPMIGKGINDRQRGQKRSAGSRWQPPEVRQHGVSPRAKARRSKSCLVIETRSACANRVNRFPRRVRTTFLHSPAWDRTPQHVKETAFQPTGDGVFGC